jgi:hypothetical protein
MECTEENARLWQREHGILSANGNKHRALKQVSYAQGLVHNPSILKLRTVKIDTR